MVTRQKAGSLNTGRRGLAAIYDGINFLIVGGTQNGGINDHTNEPVRNEVCTLKESTMTCVVQWQSEALENYNPYPELFLVGEDFCQS